MNKKPGILFPVFCGWNNKNNDNDYTILQSGIAQA